MNEGLGELMCRRHFFIGFDSFLDWWITKPKELLLIYKK